MAPVPVGLVGQMANLINDFIELIGPEYEVVHVFRSQDDVSTELPGLLKGEPIKPASNSGSNASGSSIQIPAIMIVGGGFSDGDVAQMRAVPGALDVPWMHSDPQYAPGQPNVPDPQTDMRGFMEFASKRAKDAIQKNGLAQGKGKDAVTLY